MAALPLKSYKNRAFQVARLGYEIISTVQRCDMDAASSLPWLLDLFYGFHQGYTIGGAFVMDAISLHSRGEHRARFLRKSANANLVSTTVKCYKQTVLRPKAVALA